MTDMAQKIIDEAIKAIHNRDFWAAFPEHPKAYGEEAPERGLENFKAMLNRPFTGLKQKDPSKFIGEEVSPYTGEALGIKYPAFEVDTLVIRAGRAMDQWRKVSVEDRTAVLVDALERIRDKFFEIAYATMHSTGQSFMMSFQASGPHSNDRALEALALGYQELTRFPNQVKWDKPMGKFNIVLDKTFKPVPKGIALAIGCSTFPVWNSVPGIFASLVAGNPVIVKPHPKAVLPIAIVVAEIQNALAAKDLDTNIIQLAVDSSKEPITKQLAEHDLVKIIDYTGGSAFGDYVESLPGKTTFTEKAGVNSVILDSVEDLKEVVQNLAFSLSLYSGQMCTAPQNFFIPEGGIDTKDGHVSYDEVVDALSKAIDGLVNHPKMGAGTLGAIQNEQTLKRVEASADMDAKVKLSSHQVENPEFKNARTGTPLLLELDAKDKGIFENELFGPIALVIKTRNTDESISLAQEMAAKHGAITCAAYTKDEAMAEKIMEEMEKAFTPVSLNLTGFIWVNQHAAFSDFHVTGGNPAGNASFANPEYVNKRFVWVGHRRPAN
jgi:phenylacetic acid degradation protein paaN